MEETARMDRLSHEKLPLNMSICVSCVFLGNLSHVPYIYIFISILSCSDNIVVPIIKLVRTNQLIEHAEKLDGVIAVEMIGYRGSASVEALVCNTQCFVRNCQAR